FFFSSRRRHTRSKRDWSSDVCSSDLGTDNTESTYNDLIQNGFEQIKNLQEQNEYLKAQQSGLDVLSEKWQELQGQIDDNNDSIRSEERRVGKECRPRGARREKKRSRE